MQRNFKRKNQTNHPKNQQTPIKIKQKKAWIMT
jgi:hypothetical protein